MINHIKRYGSYLAMGIFLGGLLPMILKASALSQLNALLFFYLLLNGIYALYLGYRMRHRGIPLGYVLVLPLMFALATFLQAVPSLYGYYVAVSYLLLSFFTFLTDSRQDLDDHFIPIENGFHDLKK